jgi:hypothetical protein
MSATIRRELASLLPAEKDPKIMYQLNSTLFQWLKMGLPEEGGPVSRQPRLAFYPFLDPVSAWGKMLVHPKIGWEEPGMVTLALPMLSLKTDFRKPEGTKNLRMEIATLSCTAANPSKAGNMHTTFIDITNDDEGQEARDIMLPLALQPGELGLVVLRLKYTIEKAGNLQEVAGREWQPVDIIDAYYFPALAEATAGEAQPILLNTYPDESGTDARLPV